MRLKEKKRLKYSTKTVILNGFGIGLGLAVTLTLALRYM